MAKFIELEAANGQKISINVDHIVGFTKRNETQTGILTVSSDANALVVESYDEVKKMIFETT